VVGIPTICAINCAKSRCFEAIGIRFQLLANGLRSWNALKMTPAMEGLESAGMLPGQMV
jgi:hypothetical protein